MDKTLLVEKLNQAICLELGGLLQYNQYSQVLMGQDRMVWQSFFREQADESLAHARKFAAKVTALGGVPAVEPEPVRQTSDLHEMLVNSLDHEWRAVEVYTQALDAAQDNPAYRNLLEDQIQKETEDCEELEKYLNQVTKISGSQQRVVRPA